MSRLGEHFVSVYVDQPFSFKWLYEIEQCSVLCGLVDDCLKIFWGRMLRLFAVLLL